MLVWHQCGIENGHFVKVVLHIFHSLSQKQGGPEDKLVIPCSDDSVLNDYLNDAEVREALHIPPDLGDWEACSSDVYNNYGRVYQELSKEYTRLLHERVISKWALYAACMAYLSKILFVVVEQKTLNGRKACVDFRWGWVQSVGINWPLLRLEDIDMEYCFPFIVVSVFAFIVREQFRTWERITKHLIIWLQLEFGIFVIKSLN